ncbi:MFS transporter [Photobacterium sagamiensis]|uniref:MFS transporter n=1 Tax=Photobacterium sagamiensis TaxID=2910241 RepID=UPI003D117758
MFKKIGIDAWFFSHFTYGVVQIVFIPIVLPLFILEKTGSAELVGIAMAVFGLAGLLAPLMGIWADKHQGHREVQNSGFIFYLIAFAFYILAGSSFFMMCAGAFFFGLGSAALLMMNPLFIVSAGYDHVTETRKLTRLVQMNVLGSIIAGLVLASLMEAGWSYIEMMALIAAVVLVLLVITAANNKQQATLVARQNEKIASASEEEGTSKVGLTEILFSKFGLFMAAIFCLVAGQGLIMGQYPNYMEKVFDIAPAESSVALSVAAVAGFFLIMFVEPLVKRIGSTAVWVLFSLVAGGAMMAMYLQSLSDSAVAAYIPLGLSVLFVMSITVWDMTTPSTVAKLSRVGPGLTQGLLMFTISISYAGGNAASGFIAEGIGWKSIAYIVAAFLFAGAVFAALTIRHRQRAVAAQLV